LCAPMAQAEEAPSGEVALFLTIETRAGQREALVGLWDEHLKTRAAEDDVHIDYIFALDMHDPNVVHITEVYTTQAAFQANTQSAWFAGYMAEVGPLLAGEPIFAMASPHWVK
ncbi:MAG: antibiotic biosynthesis monooxygenase, partial [Pseudomonadota bacterium]